MLQREEFSGGGYGALYPDNSAPKYCRYCGYNLKTIRVQDGFDEQTGVPVVGFWLLCPKRREISGKPGKHSAHEVFGERDDLPPVSELPELPF